MAFKKEDVISSTDGLHGEKVVNSVTRFLTPK